ncbi:MAG: type II toxin-antitoxin system HicB family antitoxin [Thermodesulfobacteriota bacterium]
METPKYPFEVRPLAPEEGGGWLVTFPDLPGCMADGKTIEEAVEEAVDAEKSYLATAAEFGDPVPSSGKFVLRLPRVLHARLKARAKQEGVSLNTLAVFILSESMGRREARK